MTLPDQEPKQKKPFAWLFEMAKTDPGKLAEMVLPYGKLARALAMNAIQKAHPELIQVEQPTVPVEKI